MPIDKQTTSPQLTLTLIAGLPGAGKTTLANHLGQELNWLVFHREIIRDALLESKESIILEMREDSASWIAYEVFLKQVKNILVDQRISIILDCPARPPFVLDYITDIANVAQAKLKIVFCNVDNVVRTNRLWARTTSTAYSPFNVLTAIPEDLHAFEHLPNETLKLDTNRPLEECVREAKKYILN
jgi:predicted kinase